MRWPPSTLHLVAFVLDLGVSKKGSCEGLLGGGGGLKVF